MGLEDRIERLRQVYGPPPTDPIKRSKWEHCNTQMAAVPDIVADLVTRQGTGCTEVDRALGAMAPTVVGEVVWRDLQGRADGANTYRAALDVLRVDELCRTALFGWSDDRRIVLAEHLTRVALRHTAKVLTSHPQYRGLFDDLM